MYDNALKILTKIKELGYEAYIVGGYPRDKYLGINNYDIDICTNMRPDELKKYFNVTKDSGYCSVVIDNEYDLVVTVCDHASQTCPMFPKAVKVIHVGFEDPDGKGFEAFEKTYKEIEEKLLPKIVELLK